ncbi:MAG: translation initiation factor IF-2, partial [Bacteroidales bacterium]
MAKDKKVTRLSKLAREFNVGISTIVDFLKKKGYDVSPNPNAKVTPEQYDLLVKEYSSDIDVKKESEKISLGHYSEESTVSISDVEEEEGESEGEEDSSEDEIIIKDVSGQVAAESEKKDEAEEEEKEHK